MFRRFMIVCWVLFAIPAIISLASWPMYFKYGNDIEALNVKPWERFDPEALILREDDAPGSPFTEEAERRREKIEQHRALESKQGKWGLAAYAGMGIAAAILLWNILCHTVQWIWQGRKVKQ